MPTFSAENGAELYIPFHAVLMCEEQTGGLVTRVWLPLTHDGKPVGINVKGTLDTVRQAFITEALQFAHPLHVMDYKEMQ